MYLQFQVKLTSTVSCRTVRSLEVHTKIHLTVALHGWEGGRCHLSARVRCALSDRKLEHELLTAQGPELLLDI